jgi:aspartate 1-decarboxylase
MSLIKLMHAKLHRVRVTDAKRDYVGSITVDASLLEAVGLLPLEEVEIVNINNGKRWSTYVLPGEKGSGLVCPNGGGALLCEKGDILILWANEQRDREEVMRLGHQAKVVVADEHNRCIELLEQNLEGLQFSSNSVAFDNSHGHEPYHDKMHAEEEIVLR